MKTYLVPMFAVVQAENPHAAQAKAEVFQAIIKDHVLLPGDGLMQDERLEIVEFDPTKHEPHSVLDADEIRVR